jgi:hypothetical protein
MPLGLRLVHHTSQQSGHCNSIGVEAVFVYETEFPIQVSVS